MDWSIGFDTGLQLQWAYKLYISLLLATFSLTCVFGSILGVCKIYAVTPLGLV
jgi:hypothetical protein